LSSGINSDPDLRLINFNNNDSSDYATGTTVGVSAYGISPFTSFAANIMTYIVTGFNIKFNVLTSPLDTTGIVTVGMCDDPANYPAITGSATNACGTNGLTALPNSYSVAMSAINGCMISLNPLGDTGLRDVYNNSVMNLGRYEDTYTPYIGINV